jgi:catalase
MSKGRLFSYSDTQRYRLGVNYLQYPINRPFKSRNYQRDGSGCANDNMDGAPAYFPNSFGGPAQLNTNLESSFKVSGDIMRHDSSDEDNFSQVGNYWRNVLNEEQRVHLIENMSMHMVTAAELIQRRAIDNFTKCDPDYGKRLKEAVEALNKIKNTSPVSLLQ